MLKIWNEIDENRIKKADRQVSERIKVRRKQPKTERQEAGCMFQHAEGTAYKSGEFHPDGPESSSANRRGRGRLAVF